MVYLGRVGSVATTPVASGALNGGFALDVIGCHVGVQVVPMIIIYQEKILFTYFDLNSSTSITNIKPIKFQGWTNINLFCFPDSIEIASLEGLTLWCPATGMVMHNFYDLKAMSFHCVSEIAYL